MNLCHRLCCSSDRWAKEVEGHVLPTVLADVDLGDNTLEIGPGYGAFLRVLVDKTPKLTAVEIDTPMAQRLQELYGDRARIINGDGTDTGLPADEFSSVVSFTMLHHVPTPENPAAGTFVANRLSALASFADVRAIQPVPYFPFFRPLPQSAFDGRRVERGAHRHVRLAGHQPALTARQRCLPERSLTSTS